MSERPFTPTQSALLELKDERAGMREGYRFLDEKRLILAAEILAELSRYGIELAAFEEELAGAAAALGAAVARHGMEELGVYPPYPPIEARIEVNERSVLGVAVRSIDCVPVAAGSPEETALASPEANRCRDAFRSLVPRAARLAAMVGNLERLREDYSRTARRARALEDVLLPEIDGQIRFVDGALEDLEREESVRARGGRRLDATP